MAYEYTYTNRMSERTKIFCRNVITKNPSEALQFEIEQQRGKRNYLFGFSLPAAEVSKFIEAIQKED
jgi:hypothetical protein